LREKINQSWLRWLDGKDGGQPIQIGGRYFALIFREVLEKYPKLLETVNSDYYQRAPRNSEPICKLEFELPSESVRKKRRADIHVSPPTGGLSLDIEVKWNDKLHENQLADYLAHVSDEKSRYFSLIHLYNNLTDEELEALKAAGQPHLSSADLLKAAKALHKTLSSQIISRRPPKNGLGLLELFIEFLEDYVMEYVSEISRPALLMTMKNSISWSHADGFSKMAKRCH
jgi:hypothetical protein